MNAAQERYERTGTESIRKLPVSNRDTEAFVSVAYDIRQLYWIEQIFRGENREMKTCLE